MTERLEWALCAICYHIIIRAPAGWIVKRPLVWILPWAGVYIHTDDLETYRRERTGAMTCAAPGAGRAL